MTRCESYPPCFGTIYFPTAPCFDAKLRKNCLITGYCLNILLKQVKADPGRMLLCIRI